jgi:tRNA-modifying protein YgfZ
MPTLPTIDQLAFGDWTAEYVALRQAAGVAALGHPTQLELTGRDRVAFLQRLCTNDVRPLAPGAGCEAFVTDAKGRIVAHVLVFAGRDSLVLDAGGAAADKLRAHLDFYLIHDQVAVHDRSGAWAELIVAGPQAAAVLARTMGTAPPPERLGHVDVSCEGATVSVRSVVAAPCAVYSLVAGADVLARLWPALAAAAQPCGQRVVELLRIELGWPRYGVDLSEKNLPQEIGRNRAAISFTKGCYLGQETVARIDALGHVNRHLVGLRLETKELPPPGTVLVHDGQPVGEITSAAMLPDGAAALALGYVRRGHDEPGTQLESPSGPAVVRRLHNGATDEHQESHG